MCLTKIEKKGKFMIHVSRQIYRQEKRRLKCAVILLNKQSKLIDT